MPRLRRVMEQGSQRRSMAVIKARASGHATTSAGSRSGQRGSPGPRRGRREPAGLVAGSRRPRLRSGIAWPGCGRRATGCWASPFLNAVAAPFSRRQDRRINLAARTASRRAAAAAAPSPWRACSSPWPDRHPPRSRACPRPRGTAGPPGRPVPEVYRARPQIGAVIHTHSPNLVVFALARRPLPVRYEPLLHLGHRSRRLAPGHARGGGGGRAPCRRAWRRRRTPGQPARRRT